MKNDHKTLWTKTIIIHQDQPPQQGLRFKWTKWGKMTKNKTNNCTLTRPSIKFAEFFEKC